VTTRRWIVCLLRTNLRIVGAAMNKLVIDNIGLYNENKDDRDEQGKALKELLDPAARRRPCGRATHV
jgi:hypothetical protein